MFEHVRLRWQDWRLQVIARRRLAQLDDRLLADIGAERDCIRDYLVRHQGHLLAVYDADFLIDAILATKERHQAHCLETGGDPAAAIDWRELRQPQIGV